jgi:hypothetical protein
VSGNGIDQTLPPQGSRRTTPSWPPAVGLQFQYTAARWISPGSSAAWLRRRLKRRSGLVLGSRRRTIGCGGRRGRPPLSRALSLRNHHSSHRYPTSEVP